LPAILQAAPGLSEALFQFFPLSFILTSCF
jgi:hypothetical protein